MRPEGSIGQNGGIGGTVKLFQCQGVTGGGRGKFADEQRNRKLGRQVGGQRARSDSQKDHGPDVASRGQPDNAFQICFPGAG